MSKETPENAKAEALAVEHGFRLLDQAGAVAGLTVRDDQQPVAWLLDAAGLARRHGRRLRLVDSGRLEAFSLEWLAQAGADLYTADDVRSDVGTLVRVRAAGRSSGGRTAFFLYGPLQAAPAEGALSLDMVSELVRSGIDLHLSNRKQTRDWAALLDLVEARGSGGAECVYYHHGPLLKDLADLAGAGAWVHVSNANSDFQTADIALLRDLARSGRRTGGGLVVHLDVGVEPAVYDVIRKNGAHLIFNIPHDGPTMKPVLPEAAYYLDTTFLP